ncbi:MAG: Na+ dependent nucleoside transporter N-terminal domain-containing protein, partial [Planctomycetota bacterium]|nr:Na+ dependent nucleoside transporter N-terminal domain-containing protein [Planctomycetota bacterium]
MQVISFCGIFVMLGICVLLSRDRKAIRWKLVGVGLLLQALLGFVFLSWDGGNAALQACGRGVDAFLKLS